MQDTALIIIDIQNEYFPGGKLALDRPEQAAENAAQLLNIFRHNKLPVVHIQHENMNPEMDFMLAGSNGQKIYQRLKPLLDETCFCKHYPNAFWQTDLENHLNDLGIKNLVITGMMTHMCVSSTARAAMERGFNSTLIQDACATQSLAFNGIEIPAETVHQTALAELGLIAQVMTLEEYASQLKMVA